MYLVLVRNEHEIEIYLCDNNFEIKNINFKTSAIVIYIVIIPKYLIINWIFKYPNIR